MGRKRAYPSLDRRDHVDLTFNPVSLCFIKTAQSLWLSLSAIGFGPLLPGAEPGRFPAPSVFPATRCRWLVFASRNLCRRSSLDYFESPSVYLCSGPSTVQWNIAGLD